MQRELINKKNEFQIIFTKINGGGWLNDLTDIVKTKLRPSYFEKIINSSSWDEMGAEILILKDNVDAKIEIDDIGNISLIHNNATEESKQKLREWATIIATEAEKINAPLPHGILSCGKIESKISLFYYEQ